jgi:hypothetical protein
VAVFLLVAGLLQFVATSIPWDTDTAYHAAVGQLIRKHGLLRSFPWTPYSWLADHYADKELLFHLLFVPFTGLGWVSAAKLVGTLAGAGVLAAFYAVWRAEGVPLAGLWSLVPLAASDVFLFRFALVRPHLLSIALAPVALWAAIRGKLVVLALTSLIYPWSYVAWQLPLALVALAEAARLLAGEGVRWKPAAVAAAALGVGLALHPNGANVIRLNWVVIHEVLLRNAWGRHAGFELGQEFDPFSPGQWLEWLLAATGMAAAAVALAWRQRRENPAAVAFSLAAVLFGALTVRTARFAEYLVPFSVAALALATRGLARRVVVLAVLAACLLYTGPRSVEMIRGLGRRPDFVPPPFGAWLREQIPPGAQVFTCDWGHTGDLMLALPDRRFIVALDPTLLYVNDPERYRLWFEIPRRPPLHAADVIRDRFGARYVICLWDEAFRGLLDGLGREPGVRPLFVAAPWSIFDLGPPPP